MNIISENAISRARLEFLKREHPTRFREIIAKLGKTLRIPVGYQNETGFHFGEPPQSK